MHSNVKLQVAAIFCVCNLVWREESGAAQRQSRLKELGLYRILLQLRHTKDTQLFDKYELMFFKNECFNILRDLKLN
jgi:hypothetical protein